MHIILNSEEYQAWHEIGHATVCILKGGDVELVEFIEDSTHFASARASCYVTDDIRKYIACGGFATECLLLQENLLGYVDSSVFTKSIFENSSLDKCSFFKVTKGSQFSREETKEFMDFATNNVLPLIKDYVDKMRSIVALLIETRKVDGAIIKSILIN